MTGHQIYTVSSVVTPEAELEGTLCLDTNHGFEKLRSTNSNPTLPGQARIRIDSPELFPYLRSQHLVPDLDKLANHLSWVSSHLLINNSGHNRLMCTIFS